MQIIQKISWLLSPLDAAQVECDGFTKLATTVLNKHGIAHNCYMGHVTAPNGKTTPIHFWIEREGLIIDYRLKMWLGVQAPHGVFEKESTEYRYSGKPIEIGILSEMLFTVLSGFNLNDFGGDHRQLVPCASELAVVLFQAMRNVSYDYSEAQINASSVLRKSILAKANTIARQIIPNATESHWKEAVKLLAKQV